MKYSIRISLSLLIALLFAMSAFAQSSPRRIEIHAHRFSFTPEEITVKRGEPVTLALTSDDVPHSLLIEGLHINALMTKGHVTEIKLTPEMVGDFKGRCDRFCGSGHGSMVFTIHVGTNSNATKRVAYRNGALPIYIFSFRNVARRDLLSGAEQAPGAKSSDICRGVPESCSESAYLALRFGISFPAQPTIELVSRPRYR
jgi:cytochrome c oxidase subunit 2